MKIPFEILDDDLGLRIILFLKTKHELYKNTYEVLLKPLVSFSKPAGGGVRRCPSFSSQGHGGATLRNSKLLLSVVILTLAIKSCSGEERMPHTRRCVVDKPSRTGSTHRKNGWASQQICYIQCNKTGHYQITSCPVPASPPPPWWQWRSHNCGGVGDGSLTVSEATWVPREGTQRQWKPLSGRMNKRRKEEW